MLNSFSDELLAIVAIDLRLLELPMVESLQAAHGSTSYRDLVIVKVQTASGQGWGECSALTSSTYGTANASQCYEQLRRALPHFAKQASRDSLSLLRNSVDPLAYAAVEMALLDATLRNKNISLKQWLGAEKNSVKAGVVQGLASDSKTLLSNIEKVVAESYTRIKIKIDPETDLENIKNIATEHCDLELHVDANGSFQDQHSSQLAELFDAGFTAIEQPFAPADIQSAKTLTSYANKLGCFVIADEAADSLVSIQTIARNQTANAIAVKSGRLGGLIATQAVQQFCLAHGLAMVAGGMLESGLGRAVLAALAACEGFTLTGDVSPASRWLKQDPWQDLTVSDGQIEVPDNIGITLPPDEEILQETTKRHWSPE